ncbi:DUF3846 domain-containing protein [Spirosoma aerophilum]
MKLIKIDPKTQTVEAIEAVGTLEEMYRIIECQFIDVCARQDNGDSLTVDDESLYQEPQPPAFSFNGSAPIHGVALLTGTDDEGGCAEPTMSVEQARECVSWLGEIITKPTLDFFAL